MSSSKKYLLSLTRLDGFGPATIARLIERFGSAEAAWEASSTEVEKSGFPARVVESWKTKATIDPDLEMEKVEKAGVLLLAPEDEAYPALLKQIYLPPALLYVRGTLPAETSLSIALVGTRKVTSYGRQVAERLAAELSRAGLTIVSGLALGIDAIAHESCLKASGSALAVLGSAVDQIYPRTNLKLAQNIMEHGALISEFPLGTMPQPSFFPMRNRIISGLSLGTVVIEAGEKSGALITASFALEQNRDVFAVPGSIYSPQSIGTNHLIQKGAIPVTCAQDILDELNIEQTIRQVEARKTIPDSPAEASILTLIESEPLHIDSIVRLSRKSAAEVTALLTMLEIKGKVRNQGGGIYSIS